MRAKDAHRLEVFDHRYSNTIAKIGYSDQVRNVQVRNLVIGAGSESIPQHISSLARFVSWVVWRTLIYRTVSYFPFVALSARNHVKVNRGSSVE